MSRDTDTDTAGTPNANAAFTYSIATGTMYYGPASTRAATPFCSGLWSGHGTGRNSVASVSARGVGPLPPGTYTVGPLESRHGTLGPAVMALTRTPRTGTNTLPTYGRAGFFIHGASAVHPETSSDGCIIMPRPFREQMDVLMRALGNRTLAVTP